MFDLEDRNHQTKTLAQAIMLTVIQQTGKKELSIFFLLKSNL